MFVVFKVFISFHFDYKLHFYEEKIIFPSEMSHPIVSHRIQWKKMFIWNNTVLLNCNSSHAEYEMKQKMSLNWLMKLEEIHLPNWSNDGKNWYFGRHIELHVINVFIKPLSPFHTHCEICALVRSYGYIVEWFVFG